MGSSIHIALDAAQTLAERALLACGADEQTAPPVARSCVVPESEGLHSVGLSHLLDYCSALRYGRVIGTAIAQFKQPTPVLFQANAQGGFPVVAFDNVFEKFTGAVKNNGISLLAIGNAYTCGALGYYAQRLAEQGLLAIVATNAGPALLAASGTTRAVFSTNPLSFAVPRGDCEPLIIDQSSSHSAYVNFQAAAHEGREIPEGWALNSAGQPTTDPNAAMAGVLLAFGGSRGANIALMVELLSAGLSGSNWSLDAPAFNSGPACPAVGLSIVAINPALLYDNFAKRCDVYLKRIESDYGAYIPGARRATNRRRAQTQGLNVAATVIEQLEQFADS